MRRVREVAGYIIVDFSLRSVTRPVTFDVELTLIDAEQYEGVAAANVNRREFGILNNDDSAFDYHGVAMKSRSNSSLKRKLLRNDPVSVDANHVNPYA